MVLISLLTLGSCTQPVVDTTIRLGGYTYEHIDRSYSLYYYSLEFTSETTAVMTKVDVEALKTWRASHINLSLSDFPDVQTIPMSSVIDQTTDPSAPRVTFSWTGTDGDPLNETYGILDRGSELKSPAGRFLKASSGLWHQRIPALGLLP